MFIRNLTYKEILEQVLTIQRDTGLKVTNVVFMGQGEPLLNLDNVLKAMEIFNENFQIDGIKLSIIDNGLTKEIKSSNLSFSSSKVIVVYNLAPKSSS